MLSKVGFQILNEQFDLILKLLSGILMVNLNLVLVGDDACHLIIHLLKKGVVFGGDSTHCLALKHDLIKSVHYVLFFLQEINFLRKL